MIRFIHTCKPALALLIAIALLLPLVSTTAYAAPSPDPGISDDGMLPIWNGGAAETYEGSGIESDPYRISTAEELALLAQQVRAGDSFAGKYFLLTGDILLNDITDYAGWGNKAPARRWVPIGGYATAQINSAEDFDAIAAESGELYVRTEEGYQSAERYTGGVIYYRLTAFSGIFDGGGHTISGLYTAENADYAGLFGACKNATLRNLRLDSLYVNGTDKSGGLAGSLYTEGNLTVDNCSVDGTVIGNKEIGGLIGYAESAEGGRLTVNACNFSGTVTGKASVGGILGSSGTASGILHLSACKNLGQLTAATEAGGIVGRLSGGNDQIMSCHNSGAIRGDTQVGGIVGTVTPIGGIATISDCQNGGTLLASSSLGGIVGETLIESDGSALELLSCRNVGELYGNESVGGIVGLCQVSGIENSIQLVGNKNSAAVNGTNKVGGILGCTTVFAGSLAAGTCENYGTITATNYAGGIIGYGEASAQLHLYECTVRATVSTTNSHSGGIAGRLSANDGSILVERSSVGGTVRSDTTANGIAGGIAGELIASSSTSVAEIKNCLSAVTLSAKESAGGIVGHLTAVEGKSRIVSSLFCGGIVTGCRITGGIAAIAQAEQQNAVTEILDCYFNQNTSSRAMLPYGGEGSESCLTTEALNDEDLRNLEKLSGLDFAIWQAPDAPGQYPTLQTVPFVWEEYQYTVTQNGAILLAYLGRSDIANIPEKLGGVAVTTILESAFWQSDVIRVILPDSVTAIGEAAFAGCERLERVTLSASLVSVGARAFQNCTSLNELRCSRALSTLMVGSENEPFQALSFTHPASLQVVHSYEDGSSAGKGSTLSYYIGDYYRIIPLEITGYEPDAASLSGICSGNARISVIYRIGTYHLTIRYLYPDGREALPSFEGDFRFGDHYSVSTPKLDGYTADHALLEGTMAGEDTQLTVYFTEVFADTETDAGVALEIILLILSGLSMICCLVYFIYRYRSSTDPRREERRF